LTLENKFEDLNLPNIQTSRFLIILYFYIFLIIMKISANSSNSSTGEGNTKPPPKQVSPAKRWCFTSFNIEQVDIDNIIEVIDSSNSAGIIGSEVCPTSGKQHLQGYIEFDKKVRPKNLFNDTTIHWEKCKGNRDANIKYCSKEAIAWTNFKLPKPLKLIENLYEWQQDIINVINVEPDDRTIVWRWDKNGNTGKTSFCKYLCAKHGAIMLGGKASDMMNCIVDYMKNNNGCVPEIILINLPRSFNADYLSYPGLESIKDMCFYSGKYEGGQVVGNCPHLIIFANKEPDFSKLSKDRWDVKCIEEDYESDTDYDVVNE
jgi:hypothetical protein